MNMKATAIAVSLAMVIAATAVVFFDNGESYGADVDKGNVYVAAGGSAQVEFIITEPADTYYNNTVTWTANSTPLTVGQGTISLTGTNSSTATLSMTKEGGNETTSTATYTASITAGNVGGDIHVELVYTITTSVDGETSGSVTQSLSYEMDIHILTSPLNNVTFSGLQVGTPMTATSVTSVEDGSYVFYAVGLPSGLQMTPEGEISGTPTEAVSGSDNVTVIATHVESNQTFTHQYTISVNAAEDGTFSYTVSGASPVSGGATGGSKYIVLQNEQAAANSVRVTIDPTDAVETIYVVSESGRQSVQGSNGVFDLSPYITGSGSYTVVMVGVDDSPAFELVVVAVVDDVQTGIGFSPGYTITD